MLVNVLASGSKGNANLIRTKKYNILVDAGMTAKYLTTKLNELELTLKDIHYIFLTHTHADHISALKAIVKQAKPKLVLTDGMYKDLDFLKDYEHIVSLEEDIKLDAVTVESIVTSHDTGDSRGYIITEEETSVVIITDTGYINQKHFTKISNKSIYIFESNHDVEMLMHGRYPKWLKRRVYSDIGHLSNESASFYLSKIIGPKTKLIALAHLSEENNTPEIALENIKSYFAEHNIKFNNIVTAKQHEQTELIIND